LGQIRYLKLLNQVVHEIGFGRRRVLLLVLAGLEVLFVEDQGLVEGPVQHQVGLGGSVRSHQP